MFNPDELDLGESVQPMLLDRPFGITIMDSPSTMWALLRIVEVPMDVPGESLLHVVQLARFVVKPEFGPSTTYTLLQPVNDPQAPWYFTRNHPLLGMKRCVFIPKEMLTGKNWSGKVGS